MVEVGLVAARGWNFYLSRRFYFC